MKTLTHADVEKEIKQMVPYVHPGSKIYGVPRGGVPVAYLLKAFIPSIEILDTPVGADFIVDDILDSGSTRDRYQREYPEADFLVLYEAGEHWLEFPWERNEGPAEDLVVRLLEYIGEDPNRGGLLETPKRFLKAWKEKTSGYEQDPADVLKVFEDGAEDVDEMVMVRDIEFESMCEHHGERIWGVMHIGYIPNKRIVGLSKLYRLANIFARRMQVQERLTTQIADALEHHLSPIGVGVVIEARHACMEARGICKRGQVTITSALRGAVREKPEARAEFFALAKGLKAL